MIHNRMRILSRHIVLYAFIMLSSYDCQTTSICAKLAQPDCKDQSLQLCGCFDLVLMRGGFAGGDYDPHDDKIFEAILIRQDSSLEYYRHDTLLWKSTFVVVDVSGSPKTTSSRELHLLYQDTRVGIQDADHVWLGTQVQDGFAFLYVRHR